MKKQEHNESFSMYGNETAASLSNIYEKMMYIMLRKYINDKKQCFPSIATLASDCSMSIAKATDVLKDLEKKGIITKTSRYLPSGGQTSNLYTIHDRVPIKPKKVISNIIIEDSVPEFNSLTSADQRKRVPQADHADQSQSAKDTQSKDDVTNSRFYDNTKDEASQVENQTEKVAAQTKYSIDELKKQYDYQGLIVEHSAHQENIDICMDIILTTVNSKKQTIRIQKEEIPNAKVVDRLLKLTKEDILWVISKYEQQPNQIHSPKAYLLTLLYDAHNQRILDQQNQKSVAAAAAAPPEQKTKSEWKASGTRAFEFKDVDGTRANNNYMAKVLAQYSLPPEDQAADVGEEAAL